METKLYNNYDELVVKCLPEYYFLLEIVAQAIGDVESIVDLGCGTGNLARAIFQALPSIEIKGIDISEEFLMIAKNKNADYRFLPFLADILNYNFGQYKQECIVSSFTIHHFKDSEKQALFKNISQALKSDGIFINCDMVEPEENYQLAVDDFLSRMRLKGLSKEFVEAEKREMAERDRPAKLSNQKRWLKKIGFQFELLYDDGLFAIYICRKL
ncbi:MAG: class I SAM-dependent methyltransferase [Patescibacteria group bacterium]|jgi:tRNA (cmo5U34)-methyltransferase|nr:class I SAM-dependent methyltransferase [Patescibacteria group bacterium]